MTLICDKVDKEAAPLYDIKPYNILGSESSSKGHGNSSSCCKIWENETLFNQCFDWK